MDLSYMFSGYKLRKINLYNFNDKNVKDMSFMFSDSKLLEELIYLIIRLIM